MTGIERIWHDIDSWLRANAPRVEGCLAPGASERDIALVERTLGRALPDDLRVSLRFHDGQCRGCLPFLVNWELLGTARMVETWCFLDDLARREDFSTRDRDVVPVGPVRRLWWGGAWLPIADGCNGDYACADLDPASGGAYGQIVLMRHDANEREVIAPDFTTYLGAFLARLEAGEFVEDGRDRALVYRSTFSAEGLR